jgi:hypothetical protein
MTTLALVALALFLPDESALREAFQKEIKASDPAKRVEAVKKLAGAKEEKTLELLAGSVKDGAKEVQVAAAETVAGCDDGGGVAIKSLCAVLVDKKAAPEARVACAKALGKARYKTDAIDAMIEMISGLTNADKNLFKPGADITAVLNQVAGQDYGFGKETPALWQEWWKENKAKVKKEDDAKREEYKKSQKK